jgi:hypothetical protein
MFDNVISDEKIFKFSQDLYKKINEYLNGHEKKEDEVIEKTINAMDEMFMIAPLSEDDMILYRGYDFNNNVFMSGINTEINIKKLVKFGIQNGYLSTTTNELLSFYYTTANYSEYLHIITKLLTDLSNPLGGTFALLKKKVITKNMYNICCFTVLHLDDGIPYIKLNNLSCHDDEVLLPRGLKMEYLYTDNKYPLLLKNVNGAIGYKTFVTAHHIRLCLTEELKKKYKKSEKCVEYDVWKLNGTKE